MTSRSLPMAEVRQPRPRARRHTVMAAVVGSYLLAALVVAATDLVADRRWLALHLLGLGAATNAVLVWSRHFAQALLHARLTSERAAILRLALLNAAVVAVLVGVMLPAPLLGVTGAGVVVLVVGWHVASLVGMARQFRLPGPLRRVVGFYVASGLSLVIGAGLGAALAGDWLTDDGTAQQRLHVAHAQLNLFGWIGLAVLGTEVVLWPAVLRTRMVDVAPRLAPVTLALCGGGLAVLVAGVLSGAHPVALGGGVGYAGGVLLAGVPMARTLPGQPSRTTAAWWVGASVCWLLAGAVVDTVRLVTVTDADEVLRPVVPMLALGLIAQALVGALTFLLPVTVGGGPVGNRRMTATLERGWPLRLVAANVGLVLVVVPASHAFHVAGWAVTLVGFGTFLPLLVAALIGRTSSAT